MTSGQPDGLVVVGTYRVRPGREAEFERLLEQHVPTLRRLGLITDTSAHVLRRSGGEAPVYVEVFEWMSDDAAARAAEVADVIAIWEPMAELCEQRGDLPGLEFPLFSRLGPRP